MQHMPPWQRPNIIEQPLSIAAGKPSVMAQGADIYTHESELYEKIEVYFYGGGFGRDL